MVLSTIFKIAVVLAFLAVPALADSLKRKAEQGDPVAQYSLGLRYDGGNSALKDRTKAVYWFHKAAEKGHAEAQFKLGVHYFTDLSVPRDIAVAKSNYWYRKAAELGNADAQSTLGIVYKTGRGVSKDSVKAAYWFFKAAKQGTAEAQSELGLMYAKGDGVPTDFKLAAYWGRKGAEQGNAWGQILLGTLHFFGQGVLQDFVLAHMWLNIANANGIFNANKNEKVGKLRDTLESIMSKADVSLAHALARKCMKSGYKTCGR